MSDTAVVEQITREVVDANTAPQSVRSVRAVDSIDSVGEDALRISIELAPEAEPLLLSGETPVNILIQSIDRLDGVGEKRFPIIDYATTDELATLSDDSQS